MPTTNNTKHTPNKVSWWRHHGLEFARAEDFKKGGRDAGWRQKGLATREKEIAR